MKRLSTYVIVSFLFVGINSFLGCRNNEVTSNNSGLQFVECTNAQGGGGFSSGKSAAFYDTLTAGTCSGCESEVKVVFKDCACIDVISCKDLSNVVLGLSNGQEYKFDGLTGKQGTFCSPNAYSVTKAWVKSGCYQSGDGPGYGYAFNSPLNCGILPIDLEDFSGYWSTGATKVQLEWTVSMEVNLDRYIIKMLRPCEEFVADNFITLQNTYSFVTNASGSKTYKMNVPVTQGGGYYFQLFERTLDGVEVMHQTIYVRVGE